MARVRTLVGRLTILNAATDSNVIAARELSLAQALIFYNAAAYTGVISVRVGKREDTTFANMQPLDNNGVAVVLTANRVQRHEVNGFESLAIQSAGAEAAQRDIDVYAILDL